MTPELLEFVARVGPVYGTEIRAWYLYTICRMHRPDMVVELGTGAGVTALAMAQALQQNGTGHVLTIDDGSHWPAIHASPPMQAYGAGPGVSYEDFIGGVTSRFDLAERLTHIGRTIPPYPKPDRPIDLLFSDYRHDVAGIINLFAAYFTRMNQVSSIFIDSASTFYPSYTFLENLVAMLNSGKVPQFLRPSPDKKDGPDLVELVSQRRFTLVHLTEPGKKEQNSMAWLKIEPADIIPYPHVPQRSGA